MNDTEKKAIKILDGIETIAEKEKLIQGTYVTTIVVPEDHETGAICDGRKACLVGSLFLSAAAVGEISSDYKNPYGGPGDGPDAWPMTRGWIREDFINERPAMQLAYGTLNEMAYEDMKAEGFYSLAGSEYEEEDRQNAAETFFETFLTNDDSPTIRDEVIDLCKRAKKHIRSQARVAA